MTRKMTSPSKEDCNIYEASPSGPKECWARKYAGLALETVLAQRMGAAVQHWESEFG